MLWAPTVYRCSLPVRRGTGAQNDLREPRAALHCYGAASSSRVAKKDYFSPAAPWPVLATGYGIESFLLWYLKVKIPNQSFILQFTILYRCAE